MGEFNHLGRQGVLHGSVRCAARPLGPRRARDSRRGGQPQVRLPHLALPSSGVAHCTDTFLFDDAGKIVRQYIVQLTEGAPAGKAPLCTEPQGGKVQASWDNHFAAFGDQDVDKILKDYTEKSVIKVYDQITGELAEFKGLKGVKELFTGLFKDLHDTSGLAAPAIRVDPDSEGIAGSVFLVWRCPTSGFTHVTDTFLFDENGKIAKQNIACIKAAKQ